MFSSFNKDKTKLEAFSFFYEKEAKLYNLAPDTPVV